jgi:ADP-ribosylglycohydrolase
VNDALDRRFVAAVIGSRVGDAMGTPTEGLPPEEIEARFGWVDTFEGDGTDDSLMATILAGVLVATRGRASADDWAAGLIDHRTDILAKRDKFVSSVLHLLDKLDAGCPPSQVALGNMPSTSSAMCIWPVGLVNAGDPDAARVQAYDLAGLIHVQDVDHCTDAAAAVAVAVASAFTADASIRNAVGAALEAIRPTSGRPMATMISEAIALAEDAGSYVDFRKRYHARFLRPILCDSLETVPAAFALSVLAEGDLATAVEYGANFGRDTDTIASMCGAICGALTENVPTAWVEGLGASAVADARGLAGRLAGALRERVRDREASTQLTRELAGIG